MAPPGQWTAPRVLVLNGGSSSGKTTLARELQALLDAVWLRLGVDTLIEAAPASMLAEGGLVLAEDGEVKVGAAFTEVEDWWMAGVARMAEVGACILIEDSFISGRRGQERWRAALARVPVAWIGVRCDPAVAAERERQREDRVIGMANGQALAVHQGIDYDLEVDTGVEPAPAVARRIQAQLFAPGAGR